eukprot:m.87325 g.87325  ORF g.87325 m.87325 type:complete len:50 (+) comp12825_c0_seq22:1037-1186(+)
MRILLRALPTIAVLFNYVCMSRTVSKRVCTSVIFGLAAGSLSHMEYIRA